MSAKIYKFTAKVWRWPGVGGWHFVTLPKKLSAEVSKIGRRYGSGFIKVRVSVGKSSWITALFPHKESESFLLSIKKNIRKKEEVLEDDDLKIFFTLEK